MASGLAFVAGCEDSGARVSPAPTTLTSTASSATATTALSIVLRLDDEERAVEVTRIPRLLTAVLPESARDPKTWREIRAGSVDERRTLAVQRFAEKYREHDVRLYVDDEGRPSVGIFRKIRADMPAHVKAKLAKPHVALVDAAWLAVRTREIQAPADRNVPLMVSIDGVKQAVGRDRLSALARVSPPDEEQQGRRRKRGWRLQDVVGLVTDMRSVARLTLLSKDEDSMTIQPRALVKNEVVVLLRFTNRGGLSASSWPIARTGPPTRLRDVGQIVIVSHQDQ